MKVLLSGVNTIPYLFVLNGLIDSSIASGKATSRSLPQSVLPDGALWPYISAVLNDFDPIQVRYAGAEFSKVVEVVIKGAETTTIYTPAIVLLHNVILRLDPTSSTLTSIHYHFVRLCLLARAYDEAANILDRPIYHLPTHLDKATAARSYQYLCTAESSSTYLTPSTGLTEKFGYRSYLEYYLYAGMVYIALRRWEPALAALEVVLAAPTSNTASMIMVEAYRKFVIVGLLHDGRSSKVPKTASPSAMKSVKAVARPYDCLADAFKSHDPVRFHEEVSEGQNVWAQDLNSGLVLLLTDAFRKFAVLRLGRTFTALSIAEVAKRTSPNPSDLNETASYIASLIANGDLDADLTISSGSDPSNLPILRFLPSRKSLKSEAQVQQELAVQTAELKNILKHISDNDHRFEISKEYIEMLKKLKKQRDQAKSGGPNDAGFEDVDEDMMEDM